MPADLGLKSRILVVAPQPFYEDRGTPIAIRHVLEALSESGREVDLLTFAAGSDITLPGLRIFRAGQVLGIKHVPIGMSLRKLMLDALLVLKLYRLLTRTRYDSVHAVEEAIFPVLILGRMRRIPVIYDMQSCMPDQLRGHRLFGLGMIQRFLKWFERWALRQSTIVVCSAGLASYVQRSVPSARAIEWTFPGQPNSISPAEAKTRKAEMGLQAQVPVVLYAGNFARYQGVIDLVLSIPHVLAAAPDTVFVLVGGEIASMPADLRRAVEQIPKSSLRVLPRQPRDALPALIAMADVLVSPRAGGDNLPLKLFDYLAAGKPIVATDYPIHRAVLNEKHAVLVEPSAVAIANGIVRVIQDKPLARRLGEAARNHSTSHYSQDAFRRLIESLYDYVQTAAVRQRGTRS